MRWSLKIGEYAGIGVYVHATFFLLIPYLALVHARQGDGPAETLAGILFVFAVFACVVLHEFGHALTAKRYGIRTRDITLLPIGGVARLEKMPENPVHELWVALAGPAVNVAIAAGLFAFLVLTRSLVPLSELDVASGSFVERLAIVNVFLVAFNLLPAFPMDGGRVLRALLAMKGDYVDATKTAAAVGKSMAIVFAAFAVLVVFHPLLLIVAAFVWIGAEGEASAVEVRATLGGVPVGRAVQTDFRALAPDDTLNQAIAALLAGSQHDFPVTKGDEVLGILTRADLLLALAERDRSTPIAEVMRTDLATVEERDMLETVLAELQRPGGPPAVAVKRDGRLVGILTPENLSEFIMIRGALKRHDRFARMR